MTPRQQQIFSFICGFISTNGYPPSFRQIGDEFGIASPNGVNGHLRALERKGLIQRDPGIARGLRIAPLALAAIH